MLHRRGFTLVELLVVIAIIAILAAIIFPVFMKAREAAETTQCISNVKNITAAVLQYVANYDGRLPDSDPQFYNPAFKPTPLPGYWGWASVIQPYLSNWSVFICPARKEMADAWTNGVPTAADGPLGYAYNGAFWQGCPGTGVPRDPWSGLDGKIPQSMIKDSSGTLMVADSSFSGCDELGDSTADPGGEVQPVCQDQIAAAGAWATGVDIGARFYPEARHQEGYVVGYCDGHAKWQGFQYLYDWSVWTIEKDDKSMPAPPTGSAP